ncbi:MAG: MmgE/PrpD family protein [Chloroflexi bacterium]|nr:MmgE/PrpD family protein [Chloroflexota bacterium]
MRITPEEQLARHICDTSYADIGEEAIDAARREVLWSLGTSVAGAGAADSGKIINFVRQLGGREEATVIGYGDRLPASLAGLANGAFAKAREYEDKYWMDTSHGYCIGPAVVSAAFATAEHVGGVNGEIFLEAVTLATDVEARMMKTVGSAIETGWNSTYVFASFGAAVAASKLLRLNQGQVMNALGLAYAQATGNRQPQCEQESVLGIHMQMGFAVRNGITAAQLAKLGVTGVHQFLTGTFGLYSLFFTHEDVGLDALTTELGSRFEGTRLGFKAYPCGAVVHPVLDAVLSIIAGNDVQAEAIDRVKVYGTTRLRRMVEPAEPRQNPKNRVDAEFSLPWAVACTIVDRRLSLSQFSDEALLDRRYAELARKVETDMDASRKGVWIEMQLKDGQTLKSETVFAARGHPDNPLSTEEMIENYRDCVRFGPRPLSDKRTEQAKDLVLRLQTVPDVAAIIRFLG